MATTNPYSPPPPSGPPSLPSRVGSFVVGPEQRLVEVFWSYWSGLEVYTVDGVEVLRTKNYQVRGTREFDAGPHHVVIKLDAWPSWRIVLRPWEWIAEAYVNDELVAEDISPELRRKTRSWMISSRYAILALFGLLALLVVGYFLVSAAVRLLGPQGFFNWPPNGLAP